MPRHLPPAPTVAAGALLACCETGIKFKADPTIPNFVIARRGLQALSAEGLRLRNLRDMEAHLGPFPVWLALNGKTVCTRLGSKLGDVKLTLNHETVAPSIRVLDLHGRWWQGRHAVKGQLMNLYPMAPPTRDDAAVAKAYRIARMRSLLRRFEDATVQLTLEEERHEQTFSNATRQQEYMNARAELLCALGVPLFEGDDS